MNLELVDRAIELLERANAELEPELLAAPDARALLDKYARAEKLAAFGVTAVARKIDDAATIARATGTSMGRAKATVATGKSLAQSAELADALQSGAISLDQASAIASAEESAPGAAGQLLAVARTETFQVLKEKARKVKLEAEQHRGLAERQHAARSARSYADELGMVHVHLAWEPHVGTPVVARAEAEAARRARAAKKSGQVEPFDRYLADAYAGLLSGSGTARTRRPELVVLVSHEVVTRGWQDVRAGEVCKIPGVGPVSPRVAKEIAADAFLSGVLFDGTDLRHFKRWSRSIPIEVGIALELGDPPDFDGVVCVDCGKRFRTEVDHVWPYAAGGPMSTRNAKPRCWECHQKKTEKDRKAGRLRPRVARSPARMRERNSALESGRMGGHRQAGKRSRRGANPPEP